VETGLVRGNGYFCASNFIILPDIIHLLPDHLANQIAAGEVIQRPASAVKELLENAVDAGADEIRLFIQDAGKALVQVVDNGKGMSELDARMAFERHATSKISNIEDLFHIKTMGFRGEALASIAAVAQVSLKTKRAEDNNGTLIEIENSQIIRQEPVAVTEGTSIAMKNLFFNVPARRNFLKSNAAELRHIVDEFTRVAMAFPHIFFSLNSNGQEMFHLEKGTLKQRIVQLLGNTYNAKLVSVQEQTDYLNIQGFVGKPETAKKTRGDQYFFVNNRFIRSGYLHHALMQAFDALIPKDSFPMYALFIDLDPEQVDINVHPTKQEIKFEDEKIVYAFVQSAVKHALAQFSITPTLDFELDAGIQQLDSVSKPVTEANKTAASGGSLYQSFTRQHQAHFIERKSDLGHWKDLYASSAAQEPTSNPNPAFESLLQQIPVEETGPLQQLHLSWILQPTAEGFRLIHQQQAHERILYERYKQALNGQAIPIQQSLFPATLELSVADAVLLTELLPDLLQLGYQLAPFGKETFLIQGTPADVPAGNEGHTIELVLESLKHASNDASHNRRERLIRATARQHAIATGTKLTDAEMQRIATQLFQCQTPNATPDGKPTFLSFNQQEITKMFGR
jgi:DNA mismatch repair protein MutL